MGGKLSQLMTDWICIATEGETVDGRVIPASWLTEMAETYDLELYTALIWPEHERYWGNSGEVLELKSEVNDMGLTKLYARLCPTDDLIYSNRRNQLLFASIEPVENFRGSGKTYLKGLGVTNTPASIGTDRMRFNAQKNNAIYGAPVPFVIDMVTTRPGDKKMSEEKKPLWQSLFGAKQPEPAPEPAPVADRQGDNKEFTEAMKGMAQAVVDLQQKYNALSGDKEKITQLEKTVGDIKEQITEITQLFNTEKAKEQVKELFTALPDLLPKFKKLDETFSKLPDPNPGEKEKTTASMIC
ncbi:GPO family capsid scaffolding protein [Serratia marcescens]|uniref:GPO family capsid scaffolding protein n=1 Tax=Serratia marcescens TaxID=615 RepID=UPI001F14DC87|nr:GPO family capsid scaffolding protein [Serratia marcescens]